jgi:hypothetical protein
VSWGFQKKTIYQYFNDKKQLVVEIILLKTTLDREQCKICQSVSVNAVDELINISNFVAENFNRHKSFCFL